MAIVEHIRNSTPNRLHANGSPEGTLLNRDSGIAGVILRVKILNLEKIDFWPKIHENSVENQWSFGNI